MPTTVNDDNGSLFTGATHLEVGDRVTIIGEARARTVTYVMGSDRKGWRACFKGQGAVPIGPVRWELVDGGNATAEGPQLPAPHTPEPAGIDSARPNQLETVSDGMPADRVIGVDFAGPSEAGQQRRKILAIEARRIGPKNYVVGAVGFNARLVREGPPGWTAVDLAEAIGGEYRARLVAMDFPFSIPHGLICDPDFAKAAGHDRAFATWHAFNAFVASKLELASRIDLSPFEGWRNKSYWQLRATDQAAGAQPALKDKFQVLFNMTLLGAALLARLRLSGYHIAPFDSGSGEAGTLIEIYPGLTMRRLGRANYKRDPVGAIASILAFCSSCDITIEVDPGVRARCESYGMDRTPPDPDGSDALIALFTGILYQEGRCEPALRLGVQKSLVDVEGVIWAPRLA